MTFPQHVAPGEQEALRFLRERLQRSLGDNLVSIKLYGSKARGDAHPGSDEDLAVVVRRLDDRVEELVWDLELELLDRYGIVAEIFTLAQRDYETSLAQQWPFMLNLEREGVVL